MKIHVWIGQLTRIFAVSMFANNLLCHDGCSHKLINLTTHMVKKINFIDKTYSKVATKIARTKTLTTDKKKKF